MTRKTGPLVTGAAMLLLMQAAGAMECPDPEPTGRRGVIPESAVKSMIYQRCSIAVTARTGSRSSSMI